MAFLWDPSVRIILNVLFAVFPLLLTFLSVEAASFTFFFDSSLFSLSPSDYTFFETSSGLLYVNALIYPH